MEFSSPEYWSGSLFPSGHLPSPGIEPRSPALWEDSLPAEPPGKPKNTGVGSLSLHQWIVPTQASNWGLLPCRRTLYQLSHQGSPKTLYRVLQKAVSLSSKEEASKQTGGPLAVGQEQKRTMLCEPPCSFSASRPAAWREVSARR